MANVQVFHATAAARREISRRAYLLFAGGAGALVCSAILIPLLLVSSEGALTPILAVPGALSCAGLGGLIGGIVMLTRIQQAIQVEVTPHRLIWREGRRIATLEYDEVERVELVRARKATPEGAVMSFPVVRFIENDGEMMEFEVTFDDRGMIHRSRFDARAIAAAVLPYLPAQAVIAPAVTEFIQSGEVDIEGLPER
ncbi:MAG: hypothetical protein Kow00124_15650 [Anaerolineae bacterium]